jgi:hypothetical protein
MDVVSNDNGKTIEEKELSEFEVFDIDCIDNFKLTPLMKAAINGHLDVTPICNVINNFR